MQPLRTLGLMASLLLAACGLQRPTPAAPDGSGKAQSDVELEQSGSSRVTRGSDTPPVNADSLPVAEQPPEPEKGRPQ